MSTNSECLFIQVRADQWYYVLEDSNAPKNAWDWREYATAYGPFPSEDAADEHLRDNHSNPGGATIQSLADGETELSLEKDGVLKKLIEEAPKNTRPTGHSSFGFGIRRRF